MPELPGDRGLFEYPSPWLLGVHDRPAFSGNPDAEPRGAQSDAIDVLIGAGSRYGGIQIGVHHRAISLVERHELRAWFSTPNLAPRPLAIDIPTSDMGAVSFAILSHDTAGTRPGHEHRF